MLAVVVATVEASVANCCLLIFVDLSLWPDLSNWSMRLEMEPSCAENGFETTPRVISLVFLTHVLLLLFVVAAVAAVESFAMARSFWAKEANSCSI